MLFRSFKILKFFTLILFVFELTIPLIGAGITNYSECDRGAEIFHSVQLQSPYSPLWLEELSNNEEEKTGAKG